MKKPLYVLKCLIQDSIKGLPKSSLQLFCILAFKSYKNLELEKM